MFVFALGRGENVSSWVGGNMTFIALAHMLDATQLVWGGGGGDDNVPCTCTHVGCYATGLGWGIPYIISPKSTYIWQWRHNVGKDLWSHMKEVFAE